MTDKASQTSAKSVKALSFEDAMSQLEKIVDALDSGDVSLEKSIDIYEQGAALQRHCEDKLKQAEMRVQKIVAGRSSDVRSTSTGGVVDEAKGIGSKTCPYSSSSCSNVMLSKTSTRASDQFLGSFAPGQPCIETRKYL